MTLSQNENMLIPAKTDLRALDWIWEVKRKSITLPATQHVRTTKKEEQIQ